MKPKSESQKPITATKKPEHQEPPVSLVQEPSPEPKPTHFTIDDAADILYPTRLQSQPDPHKDALDPLVHPLRTDYPVWLCTCGAEFQVFPLITSQPVAFCPFCGHRVLSDLIAIDATDWERQSSP